MREAQCARLAASAFALATLAACGGDGDTGPRVPTAIAAVSGNQQSGPVGTALSAPVIFRVTDGQGGVPGITVTFSITQGQGGLVSPSTGVTGADGQVQTTWTLGGTLGTQTFTATVSGLAPATAQATATAGQPVSVLPLTETTQFVVVGRTVTVQPSIRVTDAFGNPKAGETVRFVLGSSGGTLTGPATVTTDATGRATVQGWQIGLNADLYTLVAEIDLGASAVFNAFGVPAQIQAIAGTGQTANSGTQVSVPPAVLALRDDGSPLPNVPVTFEVTQGGGFAIGAARTTGANGIATVGGWVLGGTPGNNRMEGKVLGVPTVAAFTATGVPGTISAIALASIAAQNGFYGNFASESPAVTVTDASGNPVAGSTVTFEITQGGGSLVGGNAVSDFQGRAAVSAWRFGAAGNQEVRATAAGVAPVTFSATTTAVPASQYTIEVRYPGTQPTAGQRAAFDAAVARWQSAIIGDVFNIVGITVPAGACPGHPAMQNETVDDLVIFADLVAIDGPGNILGRAGPCFIRDENEVDVDLTVTGIMQFDLADLATLESNGRLNDVILHEMGHVLGIGTLWDNKSLLQGGGGLNPVFTGPSARGAFLAAVGSGTTFTGTPVPVENQGGPGTRDSHWRESTVFNELMTGILNSGVTNPLSAFSLASLRDLGYLVNDAVADPFTFQAQLVAQPSIGFRLIEEPLPGPIIRINRRGRETGRIPRK